LNSIHAPLFIVILAVMTILFLPAIHALPVCDVSDIRSNCSIYSPWVNCSGYRIVNMSGYNLSVGVMTKYDINLYYLNVTNISTGTWLLRLCDNTTREIKMTSPTTYIGTPSTAFIFSGFDIGSPIGISILFFILALWIAVTIAGIIAKGNGVGWVMFIAGLYGILFGIFLCLTLSIIFGSIVGVIGLILCGIGLMG
jgi:hypothetical protein